MRTLIEVLIVTTVFVAVFAVIVVSCDIALEIRETRRKRKAESEVAKGK